MTESGAVSRATIADVVPSCAAWAEVHGDLRDVVLFPEEAAMVAGVSEARRLEFLTARTCARRALVDLGLEPAAILADRCGAPRWPRGTVGAVTHSAGYRAAAAAVSRNLVSIGIDAEQNRSISPRALTRIASDEERVMIRELLSQRPEIAWDRLLFSAKESIYKAWYSLTGGALTFQRVVVIFDQTAARFRAKLCSLGTAKINHYPTELGGRWTFDHSLLLTGVAIELRGGSRSTSLSPLDRL